MERWRKISLVLMFGALIVHCYASNEAFFEPFDESFEDRWTVSDKDEYTGIWEHSRNDGHQDYGLLVSKRARKYGIVKELDRLLSLNEGKTVLQYEVRLQNGLECGGAYLKFLQPQEAGWTPKEFNNTAPYSVMFGPDICGATNKVHFIVRHKNPVSGEYSEHHLKNPPPVATDRRSHVYTAVIKPGNKLLQILIDGDVKKKAEFLNPNDFDPPMIPPKTIPDPNEEKPEDWDDRPEIPDEKAVKPDDWDEDAPMEIPDEEAKMPAGWMESEPLEIDDPDATKPEDWDDEEDGDWEAPRIMNPKCEFIPGCGEWQRPMKDNPAYKGKWQVPLIKNPNYKGVWSPKQIPNPNYFEMSKPDFEPISAVGIEIWTMQDGILFDNILVTRDEAVAKSYRDTLWLPKFEAEKKAEDEANGPYWQRKMFELLFKLGRTPFLGPFRSKIMELIVLGEDSPKLTMSIVFALMVLALTGLAKAFTHYRNKKLAARVSGKGGEEADVLDEKMEGEKEEGATTRKRSAAKREN